MSYQHLALVIFMLWDEYNGCVRHTLKMARADGDMLLRGLGSSTFF